MISVCIPFRNDWTELPEVIGHLLSTATGEMEVIVVNDGSTEHSGRFKPLQIGLDEVKVINNPVSFGVGYSFDRAVEIASHDTIVLMGCDVFAEDGWYDKVIEAVNQRPESIGCAVCVGDKPPYRNYYGADLLFTMGNDDLPANSKLRDRTGGYTNLFKGKWRDKKGDETYDLPCLMGAFYFTTKGYYQKIHGFDTEVKNRYMGHRFWGSLEPYLSLKSWLHGGGCYLTPHIEATHIFNRADKRNRVDKGARSAEWIWWNVLFAYETMILSEYQRNRFFDFMNYELNWGVAKKMIRQNYPTIERIRERNRQEFKNDLSIFTEKFGYSFD